MKEKGIAIVVCVITGAVVMYALFFMLSRAQRIRSERQIVVAQQEKEPQPQKEQVQKMPPRTHRVKRKQATTTLKQNRVYRRYNRIIAEPKKIPSMIRSFSYPEASLIECVSYMELLEELEHEAEVQMMTTGEFERRKMLLPLHGLMYVESCASTIAGANLKYWFVIVEQDGKRFLKEGGRTDSIPSFSVWSWGTVWKDLFVVELPKMHPQSFEVYVINSLTNERREYIVRPNY